MTFPLPGNSNRGDMRASDTVIVKCPCGDDLHFVSHVWLCDGDEYNLTNIPPSIAADLNGECVVCGCGRKTTLTAQVFVQTKIEGPK